MARLNIADLESALTSKRAAERSKAARDLAGLLKPRTRATLPTELAEIALRALENASSQDGLTLSRALEASLWKIQSWQSVLTTFATRRKTWRGLQGFLARAACEGEDVAFAEDGLSELLPDFSAATALSAHRLRTGGVDEAVRLTLAASHPSQVIQDVGVYAIRLSGDRLAAFAAGVLRLANDPSVTFRAAETAHRAAYHGADISAAVEPLGALLGTTDRLPGAPDVSPADWAGSALGVTVGTAAETTGVAVIQAALAGAEPGARRGARGLAQGLGLAGRWDRIAELASHKRAAVRQGVAEGLVYAPGGPLQLGVRKVGTRSLDRQRAEAIRAQLAQDSVKSVRAAAGSS